MAERPNERSTKVRPEESQSERRCRASAASTARANLLTPTIAGLIFSPVFDSGRRPARGEEDESPFVGLPQVEAA